MPNVYDLTGKCALLTGAGSFKETVEFGRVEGIGSAIARKLVSSGCDLLFTYNRSVEGAKALEEELIRLAPGRRIRSASFDASRYAEEATRLVARAEAELGRIDLLVNNLGTTYIVPSEIPHDEPAAEVENLMRVNFFAAYELSKRAVASMLRKRAPGYLVNVTSCSLTMPHSKRPAYGITKHALHGMLREFASAYGRHGIRILELQLGIFETVMTLPRLAFYRELCARGAVPLGRPGRPDEVGDLVAFFASGACDYLHGSEIRVDGGLTIRSFDTLKLED
ncbi:MAG: SDR family oxidoreductase [Planctomycetes bacterium]|nr:SDR family oxidoreductase [Planctomycetota bacterium]